MTKSGHHLPALSVVGGEKGDQQASPNPWREAEWGPVTQTLRVEAGVSWLCGPFPSRDPCHPGWGEIGWSGWDGQSYLPAHLWWLMQTTANQVLSRPLFFFFLNQLPRARKRSTDLDLMISWMSRAAWGPAPSKWKVLQSFLLSKKVS